MYFGYMKLSCNVHTIRAQYDYKIIFLNKYKNRFSCIVWLKNVSFTSSTILHTQTHSRIFDVLESVL